MLEPFTQQQNNMASHSTHMTVLQNGFTEHDAFVQEWTKTASHNTRCLHITLQISSQHDCMLKPFTLQQGSQTRGPQAARGP